MNDLLMSEPPLNVDAYAPQFCFCGKRTVQYHDFWFCSTQCARTDALRSLNDPECHYRNNVRNAYVQAGVPELYPRRMVSMDQLRSGPIAHRAVVNPPPRFPPPTNATHRMNPTIVDRGARNVVGFPPLPYATGNVMDQRTPGGEVPVAGRHDYARWENPPMAPSRAQYRDERAEEERLRVTFAEPDPARALRQASQSTNHPRGIKKSVAALFSRSRKDNPSGNPEKPKARRRSQSFAVTESMLEQHIRMECMFEELKRFL